MKSKFVVLMDVHYGATQTLMKWMDLATWMMKIVKHIAVCST